MRLVNYKCTQCKKEVEHLYQDSEWQVLKKSSDENDWKVLDECTCGGVLEIHDMKNNSQVWKWNDRKY